MKSIFHAASCLSLLLLFSGGTPAPKPAPARPLNVVFILADDHRHDALGFTGRFPGLQTPNLDRLAREGCHVRNAFVSTALCSPSRASILTGQYAHRHTIVDNQAPLPKGLTFFPQLLQKAGYQTAFFGKWHMGNADDAPQPGFHHWESFRGQGVYYNPTLNINGKRVSYGDSTYTPDLLTGHAVDWMRKRDPKKPFFLYLSHKSVHAPFQPARRHRGRYRTLPVSYPPSMYLTKTDTSKIWGAPPARDPETGELKANLADTPLWVKNQRYSWHGVDYLYHGTMGFNEFYRDYLETLLGVDDSVGEVLKFLRENGLDQNTVVMYMGDNGFSFGEHGLIDKRHMYEESMRVPLLVRGSGVVPAGLKLENVVQNVDIGPTILAMAGLPAPKAMQGTSFLPLLRGQAQPGWKNEVFYEYYWEYDFPQTPTMFGVRTDRYKYIFHHGVWDTNELYDLQADPWEMNNLIRSPQHQAIAKGLRGKVFDWLEGTGGMQIPLKRIDTPHFDHRYKGTY